MAEPVNGPNEREEDEGANEVPNDEPETEEEKMVRIRAVKFPVIPEYQQILRTVFPLFVRKGAKKKTELQEKDAAPLLRALALNPTDEQVDKLVANARYKEVSTTTKGHFEYENFEQRVFEFLFFEPDSLKRNPKEKVLEALLKVSKGQKEMEAEFLKKIMRTKGNAFTEDEAVRMLRVARDKDTGKVFCEEYAKMLAEDGLPPPKDPLEPIDDSNPQPHALKPLILPLSTLTTTTIPRY